MNRRLFWVAAWLVVIPVTGCKRKDSEETGAAPPPAPSTRAGICAGGGGTPTDPATAGFFARTIGDYCVDPNGDTRVYGENAKGTLDDVCTEQLDGECEVYKSFGLKRTVTLRYVDGKGSPGAVSVLLSRFATKEGAYGFFAKRVIADGDPASSTLTALDARGASALGSGVAYVYRGEHLAELAYTNEAEPPDRMRESGKAILPAVATALADKLPGEPELPKAVSLLPDEHRVPMGRSYVMKDFLGVGGLGGGGVGYYRDGEKRYRIAIAVATDDDGAEDVLSTLKKGSKSSTLKELVFPALAVQVQRDDGPRVEWVVGRKGNRVVAVGDEELVLGAQASKDEEVKRKLSKDEKIAILKGLVTGS